ncbi:MAG: hypothetical protein IT448_11705 [Phycisphaerales bacterium]|nr:hypothetical protein [Phycisphaerales bacterium]
MYYRNSERRHIGNYKFYLSHYWPKRGTDQQLSLLKLHYSRDIAGASLVPLPPSILFAVSSLQFQKLISSPLHANFHI